MMNDCNILPGDSAPILPYEKLADGGEVQRAFEQVDHEKLSVALEAICGWALDTNLNDKRALRLIGLRVIALAWVIDPIRFRDDSEHARSGIALARLLGFTPKHISELTAKASRRFGITNNFQVHNHRNYCQVHDRRFTPQTK